MVKIKRKGKPLRFCDYGKCYIFSCRYKSYYLLTYVFLSDIIKSND